MDVKEMCPAGQKNYMGMLAGHPVYEQFVKDCEDPYEKNREMLMNLISDNKDTEYGKKYGFAEIDSVEEFRKKVPLSGFDDYAEYIFRMTEKDEKNLITAYNVIHYSKSSGTMGNPKKIPFTDKMMEVFNTYNVAYKDGLLADKLGLDWANGRAFNMIESSMTTLKNGITYGAFSARAMVDYKDYLDMLFTSPAEALLPLPETNTRYLHARFALQDAQIVTAACSFHSFFLEELRYIQKNWELLVNDIANGTVDESIQMSQETRESVLKRLSPMPERAEELRKIFAQGFDEPFGPKVWPKLKLLVGIGTGGFAKYTERIKRDYMGEELKSYLCGITASEGLFTIPIDLDNPNSALIPESVFYEFLPLDAEPISENCLTMDEVEIGKDYELVITNKGGFYRYRMNDAVRVTGKYKNMPTVQFLYRINQTVSIMGEKTTETALAAAAEKTAQAAGFDLIEYSLYPDLDSEPVRYVYFMEAEKIPAGTSKESIRSILEEKLAEENPSMGDKVKRGVCGQTALHFVQPESYLLYKELMVLKGASSAQLKPVRVINNEIQRRFFFGVIDRDYE